MRVISGELRGRRFRAPDGLGTRPMLDRVREAIFSTLTPWLSDARVLDLFAGSGAMSIEALSRGARFARLVESDRSVRALELENLTDLGLLERAEVVAEDALGANAAGDPVPGNAFDIVFCDPPFPLVEERTTRRRVLEAVARLSRASLAPEGVIVLHVPARLLQAHEFDPGLATHERVYGGQSIWYVQPDTQDPPPPDR
jgi:16S rRNA (guanine(966)-N(2))-methyltransferase RsmD